MTRPDPATRPTRLSPAGQAAISLLLLLSLVSGVMIWRGKSIQAQELASPDWLHGAVVLHGALNPFLCVLFGYLLCQHIRVGWQMRANLVSGFLMEAAFAGLILTGAGLYYAGSAEWRERLEWAHRIMGILLPLALASHWIAGLLWAKKAVQGGVPGPT